MSERDAIAHPDPNTFQVLPWRPDSLVARMFCDVRLPDGEPYPGDSRHALGACWPRPRSWATRSWWAPRWSSSCSPSPRASRAHAAG